MKKLIFGMALFAGSFVLAGPSPCEAGANAAYDAVISTGGTETQAQAAYNASLKACEARLKEEGWD